MGTIRLSNRPCATCQQDTLHKGLTCGTCGTVFVNPHASFQAKMDAMKVRLVAEQGTEGARRTLYGLQKRREKARAFASIDQFGYKPRRLQAPATGGVFGRGRQKTFGA